MALADMLEKLQVKTGDDSDMPDVPDDLSGLDDTPEEPDALPEDPKPARTQKQARRKLRLSADRPGKATAAQKRQISDGLLLLLTPAAAFWKMRDPVCGAAAWDAREETAKALAPIIARNPSMVRWFTAGDAPFLDILALLTALSTPLGTVWAHHVRHVPTEDLAPGGVAVDYSAYSAG